MTKETGSLRNGSFLVTTSTLRLGIVSQMTSELLGGDISFVEGLVMEVMQISCKVVVVKGACRSGCFSQIDGSHSQCDLREALVPVGERACRAGSLSVAQDLYVVNDQFNCASDVRTFFLRRDSRDALDVQGLAVA
jgi:hypothetical protein